MGKIILVTGGSRSGKSSFAEKLLKGKDDVLYIATAIVTDKEMEKRIENHRKRRNHNWVTYEGHKDLDKVLKSYKQQYVMFECLGTMITDLMFDKKYDFDNINMDQINKFEEEVKVEVKKLINAAKMQNKNLIIVTNEVGWSLVPEYRMGRIFSDILGHMNQFAGKLSDEVYLTACGFPVKLK